MKNTKFLIITLILILTVTIINVYACEGDCVKCHPILLKNSKIDNTHKILKNCKTCHSITTNDLGNMGASCGQDCWDCHNVREVMSITNNKGNVINEHAALNRCITCHVKLESNTSSYLINILKKTN